MSHKKTLYQLSSFKWAVCAPLVTGLIVAVFIAYQDFFSVELMSACWTSECINDAILRLKVPLTIMALVFPAVALVASQHRSAQAAAQIERTDKQIAATEAKNAFENCIKHKELFLKFLRELEEKLNINCHRQTQLYNMIFTNNNYVDFSAYSNIDDFRENFLDFYEVESIKNSIGGKIDYMRDVLYGSIFVELLDIKDESYNSLNSVIVIVDVYEKLIDGLADFCLSPEDKLEIFENDIIVIKDVSCSLDLL